MSSQSSPNSALHWNGSLNEQQILDFCLAIRRLDINLTPEQLRGSEIYARTHARRFALVMNRLGPFVSPGAKIFSVGSMPNQLELLFARFLQSHVSGSTYSPQDARDKFTALYQLNDGWRYAMDVYLRDLTRQPLPVETKSCDSVLCFEVVEHFQESPLPVFREIHRVLKPNGCLLISTPNMQHWHRILYALHGITYPDLDFVEPIESRHTHIFSFRELTRLLQTAGFEIAAKFFADPWENAKHKLPFDRNAPLNKTTLELIRDFEEFQHECIFLAARPVTRSHVLGTGWHASEKSGSDWWCWTPGRGELHVVALGKVTAMLRGELYSIRCPNQLDVVVNGKLYRTLEIDWNGFKAFPLIPVPLTNGDNVIELVSRNPAITLSTDNRPLAVAVKNLFIKIGDQEQAIRPPHKSQ